MENGAVYNETTEPQAKPPRCPFACTRRHLRPWRLSAKALQATDLGALGQNTLNKLQKLLKVESSLSPILSLLAVICEEIVEDCIECGGLYVFEFVSCSAFLLSLLILFVYCTDVYETFGEDKVQRMNFWAMPVIGVCFLLASIVLVATSSGSAVEGAAYVFGFLASGAFLAEIIIERFHSRKQTLDRCSENPGNTQSATENQPLNKQS